jgi:NodT family efflux transporter outer membrane factor (OMF) lipoprotein
MRNFFFSGVVAAIAMLSAGMGHAADVGIGWSALQDPQLATLIDQALVANTDVRETVARVEAARAAAGLARRNRYPAGGVGVSASQVSLAAVEATGLTRPGDGLDIATASIDVGWEVDLFGRLRKAERAARARAAGQSAEAEAMQISVTAEVSRTYFLLRAAREQRAIRERYREHQSEIVALSEALVAEGRLAPGDLARARAEFASDVAEVEVAEDEAVRLEAALAVLLGELPGRWHLPEAADLTPLRFTQVALPAPQALLRRRPDVRAAEHRLNAENTDVAVAAAARYPQLNLLGVFGFVAGGFSDLGRVDTNSWTIGGLLRWNVFDLPRLNAQVDIEKAETAAALAAFDRTMLRAFEEIENAARRYVSAHRQAEARVTQAREARISAAAAQARYEEGASAYLDALQARRDALGADLAAAEAVAGQRVAVVGLLKALAVPVPAGAA